MESWRGVGWIKFKSFLCTVTLDKSLNHSLPGSENDTLWQCPGNEKRTWPPCIVGLGQKEEL